MEHTVTLTVKLKVKTGNKVDIDQVISDMDYNFTSNTNGAIIENTEIVEQEIKN